MAFTNPNILSSISREEFDELKSRVDEMNKELNNVIKFVKPDNNLTQNVEETIINSIDEFSVTDKAYEEKKDFNITSAKLNGTPRIEYINFNKKEEASDVINVLDNNTSEEAIILPNNDEDVINLSEISNDETIVLPDSSSNANEDVINLSDVLTDNTSTLKYTYKLENIPTNAKTSSGHRTTSMSESKLNHLRDGYYNDAKKLAA